MRSSRRIRAGSAAPGRRSRVKQIKAATVGELAAVVEAMPARYKLMVLLAAWCALRFGELTELRRSDIDVRNGVVHVRRGVVRGSDGRLVKDPKSQAGKRDVNIPPHLMPAVKAHLRDHVAASRDALVFPAAGGGHMAPSSLYAVYHPARDSGRAAATRDSTTLRHTGAVLAAATGATLAELMARLGHSHRVGGDAVPARRSGPGQGHRRGAVEAGHGDTDHRGEVHQEAEGGQQLGTTLVPAWHQRSGPDGCRKHPLPGPDPEGDRAMSNRPTIPLSEYSPLLLDEHLNAELYDDLARRVALLEVALIDRRTRRSLRRKLRQGQRDFAWVGNPADARAEAAFNEQLSSGR